MIPFGLCLQLWRKKRGLSQALLAQKAGVPQPNLSDMERGGKEVSLRTLRALAFALEIPAGILADGVGPETEKPLVLTRDRLERIAQAVAQGKLPKDSQEKQLAGEIASLMKGRLRAAGHAAVDSRTSKKTEDDWLSMGAVYRPEEIQSLVERVSEKAALYPSANKALGQPNLAARHVAEQQVRVHSAFRVHTTDTQGKHK